MYRRYIKSIIIIIIIIIIVVVVVVVVMHTPYLVTKHTKEHAPLFLLPIKGV